MRTLRTRGRGRLLGAHAPAALVRAAPPGGPFQLVSGRVRFNFDSCGVTHTHTHNTAPPISMALTHSGRNNNNECSENDARADRQEKAFPLSSLYKAPHGFACYSEMHESQAPSGGCRVPGQPRVRACSPRVCVCMCVARPGPRPGRVGRIVRRVHVCGPDKKNEAKRKGGFRQINEGGRVCCAYATYLLATFRV